MIGGEPLFQPVMVGILANAVVAFVVGLFADDRSERSSRRETIGAVALGVWLAALLACLVLGPIGSVAGWLPPGRCDGGC